MNKEARIMNYAWRIAKIAQLLKRAHNSLFIIHASRKSFSLLELIIYIAIVGGIILTVSTALVTIMGGRDSNNARFETLQNLRFGSEKIRQLIYDSTSSTVFGVCPFNILQVAISGATTTIFIDGGVLRVSSSTRTDALTSNLVTATTSANCMFTAIYNPAPAKPAIQFDLTVRYNDNGNPGSVFSDSVRTTASGRQ